MGIITEQKEDEAALALTLLKENASRLDALMAASVRPRQGTEICNFGAPSPLEALHWIFCFFSSIYVQFSKTSPLKSGESSEKSSGENRVKSCHVCGCHGFFGPEKGPWIMTSKKRFEAPDVAFADRPKSDFWTKSQSLQPRQTTRIRVTESLQKSPPECGLGASTEKPP